MMEIFRNIVNECIRIGLEHNASNLKRLSTLCYHTLSVYDIQTKYRLAAISQAAGRLSQMKRDIKKGRSPKTPYVRKPFLVSCYGFKLNEMLLTFPIRNREFTNIVLNDHVARIISDKSIRIRSFTLTPTLLSLSIAKEVEQIKPTKVIGIDRNLRNVTLGNNEKVIQINTSEIIKIKENMTHVRSTFKRNDKRIMQKIYSKFGNRQARRIKQRLHLISKSIVQLSRKENAAIVFEDLKGIRKLYRKGNNQGRKYRRKLNSWSFYELERQVVYKSNWEAIPVCFVDPRCTSQLCPICGDRTQEDRFQHRKLWCGNCRRSMDRDVVAAMNISYKGMHRFCIPKGDTGEAMVQERGSNFVKAKSIPPILKVDVSKSLLHISRQNHKSSRSFSDRAS